MIVGLSVAYVVYLQKPVLYTAERLFQFNYTLENAAVVEKESNQVVSILRSPQLKEQLGLQETVVTVYKPGPFSINLQTKNTNPELAIANLDKLAYYLSSSYQVQEIGTETFNRENPQIEKLFILGLLAGLGGGLILSLAISYIKSY